MDGDEFRLRNARIALVPAFKGATIGKIMFCGRCDPIGGQWLAFHQSALQPQRHRARIARDKCRV